MAASENDLYEALRACGAAWTRHEHPPLFTVEESQALRGALPGAHTKNLFLKDRKGALWLVTCLEDRRIRIRDLEKALGAKKCSFASADTLRDRLGVEPGAVTPLAIVNDVDGVVNMALDAQMMRAELLNVHPLRNDATLALSIADFRAFLAAAGRAPLEVDFDALEALAAD